MDVVAELEADAERTPEPVVKTGADVAKIDVPAAEEKGVAAGDEGV